MKTTRIILGLSIVCLLFSFPAVAQTTTSSIEGTVTDPNGGLIAGAEVDRRQGRALRSLSSAPVPASLPILD